MTNEVKLHEALNKQVVNWTVLYTKLHNFHWYVKGSHFFTLHEKFEELYGEASTNLDELAERLLSIGGKPVATLKETLELTTIKEAKGGETAEEMVQTLVAVFKTIIDELKEGMEVADAANDEGTSDMFLEIRQNLEKHNWMLEAFLG